MQSERRTLAIAMALIMCLAGTMILSSESDAEQEYDKSLGSFWSYTVQFIFDGSSTQSIEWDFGDGTTSTEWNPKHTFSEKGTYYVTQTLSNTVGTTSSVYKVEILGFPYITLVYNNGSENVTIQQTAYKVSAQQPEDPVMEGYNFTGWFTDIDCTSAYDWSSNVTSPVTLYAGWSENPIVYHQVSFDANGGSVDLDAVSIADGATFTVPDYTGSRKGYTFSGWMVGDVPYDVGLEITVDGDTILVAQWVQITYTVTFDPNGGSSVESQTVAHGGKATVPTQPTRSGYTFVQWSYNGSAYDFDTTVTENITLVAEWRVNSTPVDPTTYYNVRFESDGETLYTRSVREGGKVTAPEDPVKDGFTFLGWYLNGQEYDFSASVNRSITLVAMWEAVPVYHTVSFDTDGGSEVPSQTIIEGGHATIPGEPVREGSTFAGWFLDGVEYDFSEPVVSDITLTAHWTAADPGESGGSDDVEEGDDAVKVLTIVAATISIILILIGLALLRL